MSDTAARPTSVNDTPGKPADAQVTRQQIGAGVLMSCAARDFMRDDDNGLLMMRVGPGGSRNGKVLVRLTPADTYSVEYGYADMRASLLRSDAGRAQWGVWQTVEVEHDVHAESLATVVRRLGDREHYFPKGAKA